MHIEEMKAIIAQKFENRQGQFNLIKAEVENLIDDILVDCKDVLVEIPTLKDFGDLAIEAVDDATDTGMLDMVDHIAARFIFSKYIDSPKAEEKYKAIRDKAISSIDSVGK